jgi:hypothetical protein
VAREEVPGTDGPGTDPPEPGGTAGAGATRVVDPDRAAGADRPGSDV